MLARKFNGSFLACVRNSLALLFNVMLKPCGFCVFKNYLFELVKVATKYFDVYEIACMFNIPTNFNNMAWKDGSKHQNKVNSISF